MIIYFHCIFRLFSVFAGLFLIIAFVIQSQGDNICIWRISSILNIPVAFISACSPKYIGTYSYERSIPRKFPVKLKRITLNILQNNIFRYHFIRFNTMDIMVNHHVFLALIFTGSILHSNFTWN